MRKLISATLMGALLMGFGVGISGCSEEAKEKSEVTTTGPGGKTTQTVERKIETSGSNPPAPTKTP
jgi:hypothetical protein